MIHIGVITIFPDMFNIIKEYGITKKAFDRGLYKLHTVNLRSFADNKHFRVDDYPFGGGGGMVLSYLPIAKAIECLKAEINQAYVIYTSPSGMPLTQELVKTLANKNIIFICGRYEGIDERIIDKYVDKEICTGDYIVSGGELPVMNIMDAIIRLIPGALGNSASTDYESFEDHLLTYPQYTRPANIDNQNVPDVLLSGNHKEILKWRLKQRYIRTQTRRKDLIQNKEETHEK